MNNLKKRISAGILAAFAALSVTSCGTSRYSEDEIRTVLQPLLEKSHELNVIYFGEGLPLSDDAALVETFYGMFDSDVEAINYHPVDPDCGYTSENAIREATLAVFTADYSEYLFSRAFRGISEEFNEDGATAYTATAIYAMYLEQDGLLTARINIADDAIPLGRTYDLDGMKILDADETLVVVEVPTEMNGKALDVELRLIKTPDGWRLDSPTY